MTLSLGRQSGLKTLAELLIVGVVVGALLNSKDIQRYLKIRSM